MASCLHCLIVSGMSVSTFLLTSSSGKEKRSQQGSIAKEDGSVLLTSSCYLSVTKQVTLMSRSTVPSLPFQLVFPGHRLNIETKVAMV